MDVFFRKGGEKMETLVNIISNVGFPIFAFLLMYKQSNGVIKENTKAILDLKTEITKSKEQKEGG